MIVHLGLKWNCFLGNKQNLFLNRFWNAERMSLITFYATPDVPLSPPPAIRSLAFSSDGSQIAVGYENGYIEIYKTTFVI
jgi:hypothetical protein